MVNSHPLRPGDDYLFLYMNCHNKLMDATGSVKRELDDKVLLRKCRYPMLYKSKIKEAIPL